MKSHPFLLATLVPAVFLGSAIASDPPERPADLLRGPDVPEQAQRTLVHEGMRSGFQRVEGRPEAAAVRLLDLPAERFAPIQAAFRDYDMEIAMMLVDRIDDVRVISDAVVAGDREEAQRLMLALWQHHDPKQQRSPLLNRLAPLMAPDELAEVTRLVDEYWAAWIRSEAPAAEMDEAGRAEVAARTERRLAFLLFQEEVRQGYELTLRRYRDAMDSIYAAVEPTEEQRAALRTIILAHIKSTRLEATQAQRRGAYHEMYSVLDETRRQKLFDYLLRQVIPGDQ